MTKEQIGQILRSLRIKSGKTQKEVADIIGRTQQIVGHWETGYSQPDANMIFTLCDIYGASVDEAFGYNKKAPIRWELKNNDEKSLISNFRNLTDEGRKHALAVVESLVYRFGVEQVPLEQVVLALEVADQAVEKLGLRHDSQTKNQDNRSGT